MEISGFYYQEDFQLQVAVVAVAALEEHCHCQSAVAEKVVEVYVGVEGQGGLVVALKMNVLLLPH